MTFNTEILRKIVDSGTADLRALALVARSGRDPTSFYRGANFNSLDLRGQDMSGFDLTATTFLCAIYDDTTIVDPKFRDVLARDGVWVARPAALEPPT